MLVPHPEDGCYCQTYCVDNTVGVDKAVYQSSTRQVATSIYYLLQSDDYSAWHQVISNETWYYHQGSSVTFHLLDPRTQSYHAVQLANSLTDPQWVYQYAVAKNTWFL